MSSIEYSRREKEVRADKRDEEKRKGVHIRKEREKGSRVAYRLRLLCLRRLVSCRISVFGVASLGSRQSREPTFAIRSRDEFVCEEPGSRNKIDVEKEKRWSR